MYEDDKIFGPLTLKQFVYCAAGVGIVYLSYRFLPLKVTGLVVLAVIAVLYSIIRNMPVVVIDETYLKSKKFQAKNPEEFQRWLQKKIAEVSAQINERKVRGLIDDPKLEAALKMLQTALVEGR